jgi:hypothetical protein
VRGGVAALLSCLAYSLVSRYLIKWGQLRGLDRSSSFVATWDAAINSSIAHLVQKTGVVRMIRSSTSCEAR